MDNRRVAGQTGLLALTAVLLLVLLGCPQETPPETDTPPPSEQTPVDPLQEDNELLLDHFAELESRAGTGEVILRVTSQGPTKSESSICNRKIQVQTYGPTIFWEPDFSPIEVRWVVAQSPFGSWMEGDRIHIERKVPGDDPCFSAEPFDFNYPDLDVESDQPMQNCKIEGPWPAFWLYKATLFNTECGEVDSTDPLVIIKRRP